ncbi:hypothetical protein Y032_0361g3466 [Ancylostoma ceylanicum]|uniref:Uncharacterized protein n=1 Tax=Ancylostoma ceylanicum TaxID=53326 RepID=A0A016RW59_9BILA|nr:hypothetical protein Y032_0361g3466 [Ancylostoma ceylanicum]
MYCQRVRLCKRVIKEYKTWVTEKHQSDCERPATLVMRSEIWCEFADILHGLNVLIQSDPHEESYNGGKFSLELQHWVIAGLISSIPLSKHRKENREQP